MSNKLTKFNHLRHLLDRDDLGFLKPDRIAQEVLVGREFRGGVRTRDDPRDRRVGERKLQRRRRQRHLMTVANCSDRVHRLTISEGALW
jgi:hypothetical protein